MKFSVSASPRHPNCDDASSSSSVSCHRAADAADAYRAALARVGSAPERRFLTRRLAAVAGAG